MAHADVRRRHAKGERPAKVYELKKPENAKRRKAAKRGLLFKLYGLTVAAIILFGVYVALLPCPIQPVEYSLPPAPAWTGPLEPNNQLTHAERLFEGQLVGAESLVVDGDYIYTSSAEGRVVKIYKGEITTLARFGKTEKCGSIGDEPVCGRPLGMRLDKDGNLLVIDGFLGLYRVNIKTGAVQQLLSSKDPLAGHRPMLLNDVAEGKDGIIYFTDSSTRWDRIHHHHIFLEGDTSGRLLSYNPKTEEVKELVGGLAFANGIVISPDNSHILVVESTMARVIRYHLKGPQKGKTDVFADNLPGFPDNIRESGRGTYWLGMAGSRGANNTLFTSAIDMLAGHPWLRSLVIKLVSPKHLMRMVTGYGLAVELDKDGNIISSLHDPTGKRVPSVSEVIERDGFLYLGTYYQPFISRVKI